ncbi:hypothetical protein ABI59_11160 [Acidobacteria bacterium Mor1]|nr:hypothetical protein ABI59_11160 [Acidobacteria bacterium Mor1]
MTGAAAGLMAALLLAPGCTDNRATTPEDPAPSRGLMVYRGNLQSQFLVTGTLEAVQASDIKVPPNPTWQIPIRWMERDGATVKAGDPVLELDNTELLNNLDQQELAWLRAANDLAKIRADVAVMMGDKEFELDKATVALEKARIKAEVPADVQERRTYQEAQLEYERARIAFAKAEADLESYRNSSKAEIEVTEIAKQKARLEADAARSAIEALTLRAPADGILVIDENRREDRKFQVGDSVNVGTTVMKVPSLDAWKVTGYLSDVDDGRIAPGMRARCVLDAYPDLEFEGTVEEVAPIAQSQGFRSMRRAFHATILLDKSDPERMRPGMSVKVTVELPAVENVLLAPRAGLDLSVDPPRARKADGSDTEVQVTFCSDNECILESGLSEGERLRRAG